MSQLPKYIKWFILADLLLIPLHLTLGQYNTFFNLDHEANIPTLYQTYKFIWFGAIAFFNLWGMGILGKLQKKYKYFWASIGGLLLALALDEAAQLHESVERYLTESFPEFTGYINEMIASTGYIGSYWVFYVIPFIIAYLFVLQFQVRYAFKNHRETIKFLLVGIGLILLIPLIELWGTSGVGSHYWKFPIGEELTEMLAVTIMGSFVAIETNKVADKIKQKITAKK